MKRVMTRLCGRHETIVIIIYTYDCIHIHLHAKNVYAEGMLLTYMRVVCM